MKKYMKQVIILAIFILLPLVFNFNRSFMTLLNMAGIYVVIAIGFNILLGYAGQISLGHAAFVGIGAYTTAILSTKYNLSFILIIPIVILISGILGFVLGLPALRLQGNYLAIATLGFGVAFSHIFMEWESVTGGFSGIKGINPPTLFGYQFKTRLSMYYFILFFIVVSIIFAKNLIKTKTGRALMAIRDSEYAAMSLGIDVAKYKTIAFLISAIYAGVAGSLYAFLFRQVYPNTFDVGMSLNILAMIVIGGIASIEGSVVGALFITLIPEFLKNIKVQNASFILTGLLLILCVMYFPYGLVDIYRRFKVWLKKKAAVKDEGVKV
ncbi:MAG: ABC-type transporter, integral rane subunit [Caloramator sp.]|jgi:branched-chain amino acid transport system permease protein|uniref:branched-chain amino acid ABC transporter permease n=1 Tax=Caloramator sp. TaxID=1871330 RepID=UPI001DE81B14|nr:branched-chain amino acid ABC transporter permease [Caloramator sp.]MBZ4663953.1 ABC-type transporter, integral rane subunit [Caloramator sp.]